MLERQSTVRLRGPRPSGRGRIAGTGMRAIVTDERGVAALELSLMLPLLVALLLGAADLALTAARARQVEALAESAAKAVVRVAGDLMPPLLAGSRPPGSAIGGPGGGLDQGAGLAPLPNLPVTSLVELPDDVSASLRLFRGCPAAEGISEAAGTRCPDGSPPAAFAEIAMTVPVERLVDWPSALLSPNVSARSLVRLD